ncbi:MAG: hypothetical protein EBT03_12145 [Betaproteobacteria bacterium]|nr:hypothetical protein [Betaproteobacteria bacterium]
MFGIGNLSRAGVCFVVWLLCEVGTVGQGSGSGLFPEHQEQLADEFGLGEIRRQLFARSLDLLVSCCQPKGSQGFHDVLDPAAGIGHDRLARLWSDLLPRLKDDGLAVDPGPCAYDLLATFDQPLIEDQPATSCS